MNMQFFKWNGKMYVKHESELLFDSMNMNSNSLQIFMREKPDTSDNSPATKKE